MMRLFVDGKEAGHLELMPEVAVVINKELAAREDVRNGLDREEKNKNESLSEETKKASVEYFATKVGTRNIKTDAQNMVDTHNMKIKMSKKAKGKQTLAKLTKKQAIFCTEIGPTD